MDKGVERAEGVVGASVVVEAAAAAQELHDPGGDREQQRLDVDVLGPRKLVEGERSVGVRAGGLEEDAVGHERMHVGVCAQRGAEILDEADGAGQGALQARLAGEPALEGEDGAQAEVEDGGEELRVAREVPADAPRKGEDPLSVGHVREHVVDEVSGDVVSTPRGAGGADTAALAGERDESLVPAVAAAHARKAMGQHAALEVAAKLALDEAGEAVAVGAALPRVGEDGLELFADDAVEEGLLGLAATVGGGEPAARGAGMALVGVELRGPTGAARCWLSRSRRRPRPAPREVRRGERLTGQADAPQAGRELLLLRAGNPMACAAALAALKLMQEEKLADRAAALGAKLSAKLLALQAKHPLIGDVRGLGAMQAIELVTDRKSRDPATAQTAAIVATATERGLLLLPTGTFGNMLRFLMPLVISDDVLDEALSVVDGALVAAGKS